MFFVASPRSTGRQESAPVAVTELGFKGAWAARRAAEYVEEHGSSQSMWEFGGSLLLFFSCDVFFYPLGVQTS